MAGIFGEHVGLIIENGREEIVVGIGLRPEDLTALAARLAAAERNAGGATRSVKAVEAAILAAARSAAIAAVARRERRLARLEAKAIGKTKRRSA